MTTPRKNRYQNNRRGSTSAALIILAVILFVTGAYFLFAPRGTKREPVPPAPTVSRSVLPPRSAAVHGRRSSAVAPGGRGKHLREESAAPRLPQRPEVPPPSSGHGRLAIIIDDMGASLHEARSLAEIGVPLTFSIIPGLKSYREVARYAAANGVEIMIHVPMQSKEWPRRRLEANGLLVSMPADEIRERMKGFVADLPGAVGVNNHMGSEFTEHEDKMQPVLDVLKERGIFFVDSVTSSRSVGMNLSRETGIRAARRNVFLDNEQNGTYIRGQIAQAARMAKKSGAAIAICHPHPATIQTLAAVLPGLAGEGVTVVPASSLVH